MAHSTPYFPSFRPQCAPLGRQIRRVQIATDSLSGLAGLFGVYFAGLLVPAKRGPGSRQRDLPRVAVFWAFLGQVLTRGASCRWAVAGLQADAALRGRKIPGDTGAYCQARSALPLAWLKAMFDSLARWFEPRTQRWCGRIVRLLDGSGFSMPDTKPNRQRWPYAARQKPGCGFPTGKLNALFCLHTGRMLGFVEASWKTHDVKLAEQLLGAVKAAEVWVADRGYCSWLFLALLRLKKADFVIRLHHARKVRKGPCGSWLEQWTKPEPHKRKPSRFWRKLPETLPVRLVRFKGRTRQGIIKKITVVTSLLDEKMFPDSAIAQLYAQRWQIELHYRQIKTNLSLDILRCLTPKMIEKELWMHAIAYNLVRLLLLETSLRHHVPLDRLSFKGALDAVHAWAGRLPRSRSARSRALNALFALLASDLVPFRPNRNEPRARKRRPKSYQLLTKPRHKMRVSDSRRC